MDEDESSESSDSGDDLEETPAFIGRNAIEMNTDQNGKASKQRPSRLDALLAEHKREGEKQTRLRALRDQLLTEIASCSEERNNEEHNDLISEHADHIEKLKVKSVQLRTVHPGLAVFNADKFCCLFSNEVDPQSYFVNTDSCIDKIWQDFLHGDSGESRDHISSALMFPNIFVTKIAASPNFQGVMQWLLDLLSVQSSTTVASRIEETMIVILNQLQNQRSTGIFWKPTALGLLRLLVNLGANPQELTENQKAFIQDEMRKHLDKTKDKSTKQTHKGKVSSESFRAVLTVLTHALKGRSVVPKEDLTFMFYLLAKAALDISLDRYLEHNFQQCFAAVIEHYSEHDWPAVVPDLCQQLSQITDHHHNQVHLARLLPLGQRGSYLQLRVSYTFLYNQLSPGGKRMEFSKLQDLQLNDALQLDVPTEAGQPSTLAVGLHNLVQSDCYVAFSVLELLNIFVGDISYRASVQKKQLEYLVSQVTLVRKTIRDRVSDLDLLKVKDLMNDMTVKWSLGLQDQRMKEGSIFPWTTATTHQLVRAEILLDRKELNFTEKEDSLLSNLDRQNEAP